MTTMEIEVLSARVCAMSALAREFDADCPSLFLLPLSLKIIAVLQEYVMEIELLSMRMPCLSLARGFWWC